MSINESWYLLDNYSENVSEAIGNKIALLREQESRIAALKKDLERLEIKYHQLRKELEPYRILPNQLPAKSSAKTSGLSLDNSVTYINRVPNDLLYIIFKMCLECDHYDIWQLLSVSRRWNQFIMRCPALWAQIHLSWGYLSLFKLSLERPLLYLGLPRAQSRSVTRYSA